MVNYKGLKAVYEHLTITDEQVDQHMERLLQQNQKTVNITNRAAELGDEVIIDYAGYCDGIAFEGGTAEQQPLTLGSGMFIPGFEDQLIGKKIGEDVDVLVTFPTPYHAEHLAGKEATFRCKIHEIHAHRQYEANDEFAQEVGGCETFAEFRQQLWDSLQAYVDHQAEQELKDRLMDQLVEQFDGEITPEQLEKATDIEMRELEGQLAQQNLSLDQYCQFMETTREQLRADFEPSAMTNVKRQAIFAEIARVENIEADEQSVSDAFIELCRENNLTVEQLQPYFDQKMEAALARSVVESKVLDVIKAHAEITVVEK